MPNLLNHVRRAFVWPWPRDDYPVAPGYFTTSNSSPDREEPPAGFEQLAGILRSDPVVFACELKRLQIFSEARFKFRDYRTLGLFGTSALTILEQPWPRGTTGDLLTNAILHADIGGNAFVVRDEDRLRLLRPDWTTIVMGDRTGAPIKSTAQLDAEVIGFIYDPRDGQTDPEVLLAEDVAHWAPIPDPLARFRGMSWFTPVIREIQADQAATAHKLQFFRNGANPQMVFTFGPEVRAETIEALAHKLNATHDGWQNAYKNLYLGYGATPHVVGKDLQQVDFTATQGKGETRIIAAAGLHPAMVPASEGMQGSSLNAGNYGAVRRSVADATFRPLWRHFAGCLGQIVPPPDGSELWYDEPNIPFLREDVKDDAEAKLTTATALRQAIDGGFDPSTVIAWLAPNSGLRHTGKLSVQLQPPGDGTTVATVNDEPPPDGGA